MNRPEDIERSAVIDLTLSNDDKFHSSSPSFKCRNSVDTFAQDTRSEKRMSLKETSPSLFEAAEPFVSANSHVRDETHELTCNESSHPRPHNSMLRKGKVQLAVVCSTQAFPNREEVPRKIETVKKRTPDPSTKKRKKRLSLTSDETSRQQAATSAEYERLSLNIARHPSPKPTNVLQASKEPQVVQSVSFSGRLDSLPERKQTTTSEALNTDEGVDRYCQTPKTTAAEVRSALKNQMVAFAGDYQYHVKCWMSRARIQRKLHPTQESSSDLAKRSPFKGIGTPADQKPTHSPFEKMTGKMYAKDARRATSNQIQIIPVTEYTTATAKVPRYTTYSPVRMNTLVNNVKKLAVYPDLPQLDKRKEEQLHEDLKSRYTHENPDTREELLVYRAKASHMISYLHKVFKDVGITMDDILFYYLENTAKNVPPNDRETLLAHEEEGDDKPEKKQLRLQWALAFSSLSNSTSERQYAAELVCEAFKDFAGFNLWHAIKQVFISQKAITARMKKGVDYTEFGDLSSLECRVCRRYGCTSHGEIKERQSDNSNESSDEDDPGSINYVVRVVPQKMENASNMAYRLADLSPNRSNDLMALAGMDDSSRITDVQTSAASISNNDNSFKDHFPCSESCFRMKINRHKLINETEDAWTETDHILYKDLVYTFGSTKRGPCMISRTLNSVSSTGITCLEIFRKMLQGDLGGNAKDPSTVQAIKKTNLKKKQRSIKITDRSETVPFLPCNHEGTCKQANCRCFKRKMACERTCMCGKNCTRRFRGCSCARTGMPCWQNPKCMCFDNKRECDSELCSKCGADEVLDPLKRRLDLGSGLCCNVGIQRGVAKYLILGKSEIMGFGVYAGEVIKRHEFIAEYTGEVVTKEEADRRWETYQHQHASYLFTLNKNQDVDAAYAGNKTRFINSAKENKNCEPALLLCNTTNRIGIYALRDIQPGEELFFDYGYPEWANAGFVEESRQNGKTVLVKMTTSEPGTKRSTIRANAKSSLPRSKKQRGLSRSGTSDEDQADPDEASIVLPENSHDDEDYEMEDAIEHMVSKESEDDNGFSVQGVRKSSKRQRG